MVLELDGLRLFYTDSGRGEPLVLVHGSWGDHHNWDAVAPGLARAHRVIAYDRRGFSASPAVRRATVHDHVADLVALVDALGAGRVHLVANSGGASIALRVAAFHPDRVRSLTVHEPPLMKTLDPTGPMRDPLAAFAERHGRVEVLLRAGRMEEAARTFVDTIALGPGAWERLPERSRETFVRNAPTFLAEIDDPDVLDLDLHAVAGYHGPALMTQGEQSPPLFPAVVERVAPALPQAARFTFRGAGHVPHLTHPREFVERVDAFLASAEATAAAHA